MRQNWKRFLAGMLSTVMVASSAMGAVVPAYAANGATTDSSVSEREVKNMEVSRYAATQGMVLLKNENSVLPLAKESKIALYGAGAYATVKGGTGSGDVNQRNSELVNVADGLATVYDVTTQNYLDEYANGGYYVPATSLLSSPTIKEMEMTDEHIKEGTDAGATTAVYVIARVSGEGADRSSADYCLSDIEKANIEKCAAAFENVIVILNVGGVIDMNWLDSDESGVDSILHMSQAGMKGGIALAQIMDGEVSPSGKLTDTWPVSFNDFPSTEMGFSKLDDNVDEETYAEGIFVGYRYFDTFGVTPVYEFGYGESYTDFSITTDSVTADADKVTVTATVTNTGDTYSGKEVVEVYFSAPEGSLVKPYQELAAWGKTDELKPGESQTLVISFDTADMSSYDESKSAYVMEDGYYYIRVGNSSRNTKVAARISLDADVITEQLSKQIMGKDDNSDVDDEFEESARSATPYTYNGEANEKLLASRIELSASSFTTVDNSSPYDNEEVTTYLPESQDNEEGRAALPQHEHRDDLVENIEVVNDVPEGVKLIDVYNGDVSMEEFVASLSINAMARIVEGEAGAVVSDGPVVGAQANTVNGAAGETTGDYYDEYGIPNTVLADGPAGLRLTQSYNHIEEDGVTENTYYQFCTAFPIGTMLCQTWDPDVIEMVGEAVGVEMHEFGVTYWLAPALNIHRNPLCGRNFEYFSEDPLLSGMTAADMTNGVQASPGVGVTLKHYVANNQEENRNHENNKISERAMREIYLKGFEIGVKAGQPMAVMTSYNMNNGEFAAANFDTIMNALRGEWNFKGVVMTDWYSQADICDQMHAGNDLIMPGGKPSDVIGGLIDYEPVFGDDGYIITTVTYPWANYGWMVPQYNYTWNEFTPSADGNIQVSTEFSISVGEPTISQADVNNFGASFSYGDYYEFGMNTNMVDLVSVNAAKLIPTSTGKDSSTWKVTYTGSYPENNKIYCGDVQRSTMNILQSVMASQQFADLNGFEAKSYAESMKDILQTYFEVVKGEIIPESGSTYSTKAASSDAVTERETKNSNLSMKAATEGMVLLENDDEALPIASGNQVALFGSKAAYTIKGGTGSGDVNQRSVVNIYDALSNVYDITSKTWIENYKKGYDEEVAAAADHDGTYTIYVPGQFGASPSYLAKETAITEDDIKAASANTAIYVFGRTSGEGADRTADKGDYYLSDIEKANLELIAKSYDKVIVVLNVGGVVDTAEIKAIDGVDAIFLASQAGQRIGDAMAEIFTGNVSPSGKLASTWAASYTDYPEADKFGSNDESVDSEQYSEGIYVGYRYFDTFNIKPEYEFGYGKSYTDFEVTPESVSANADYVTVTAKVSNTGDTYSGKEVVQVYFSAPSGNLDKPYQELAAFAKTDEIAPGKAQTVTIKFRTTDMSSYSESMAGYVMEAGDYVIRVGNSSRNTTVAGRVNIPSTVITEQLSNQKIGTTDYNTIDDEYATRAKSATPYSYDGEAAQIEASTVVTVDMTPEKDGNHASALDDEAVTTYVIKGKSASVNDPGMTNNNGDKIVQTVEEVEEVTPDLKTVAAAEDQDAALKSFVASVDDQELARIVTGIGYGAAIGSEAAAGNYVQGAAGYTTDVYFDTQNIANTSLADGPAGVRLTREFTGDDGNTYYQFATAWPIGTCLAQTWNVDLLEDVGEGIGEEMVEYGVTLWLAPGMNIHRNPLNGRNFEYYSEDPLVTGLMATYETKGVQSNPGVGVTLKHYAGNNQENNRNKVDVQASERAWREIYLKGFEIAVKGAQPMAIMTSYNLLNGKYACGNYDLVTDLPRGEWGYEGMVMTDWGAANRETPASCMHAGNDLIMPGGASNQASLLQSLEDGTDIYLGDLQRSAMRILKMIMNSNQFAQIGDASASGVVYGDKFASSLINYLDVSKSDIGEGGGGSSTEETEKKDVQVNVSGTTFTYYVDYKDNVAYTGKAQKDMIEAVYAVDANGTKTKVEKFKAKYKNNKDAGTCSVTLTIKDKAYKADKKALKKMEAIQITITPKTATESNVTYKKVNEKKGKIGGLKVDGIKVKNGSYALDTTAKTITFSGNFTGTVTYQ